MLKGKNGFTAVEVIVVVSIIAVILGMVIGVGRHIREQARRHLAESTADVIVTAVEQYYQDEGRMPFEASMAADADFDKADFEAVLGGGTIAVDSGSNVGNDWSGEALYYYLSKNLNSERIVNALNESAVSSLNAAGAALTVTVTTALLTETVNMPRFIDPWGSSFRYRYNPGDSFCVITSAGPDGDFATAGDNVTNR